MGNGIGSGFPEKQLDASLSFPRRRESRIRASLSFSHHREDRLLVNLLFPYLREGRLYVSLLLPPKFAPNKMGTGMTDRFPPALE